MRRSVTHQASEFMITTNINVSPPNPKPHFLEVIASGLIVAVLVWCFFGIPALTAWEIIRRKDLNPGDRALWLVPILLGLGVGLAQFYAHHLGPVYMIFFAAPVAASFFALLYTKRPLFRWSAVITLLILIGMMYLSVFKRHLLSPRVDRIG
jgi:hypothetical protein